MISLSDVFKPNRLAIDRWMVPLIVWVQCSLVPRPRLQEGKGLVKIEPFVGN